MSQNLHPSVDGLNLALRCYRRLLFRSVAIVVLGFAAAIGLSEIGTLISPPYGLYILGEGLGTWGLIVVVALLIAEFYWEGRQIGQALNDPATTLLPLVALTSGLGIVAQRATTMGMEWSGFLGPLRPVRRK